MKSVVTIAGSDSSGGAGIQADIKTMTMHGVFAQSVVTALTAQNTLGVQGVMPVDSDFVRAQIDSVFTDIKPDAVKIGMISSPDLVKTIAQALNDYQAENIVVDPVMVATSGASLSDDASVQALMRYLVPLADLVTPNIPEACVLANREISTQEDMVAAARDILALGCKAVLVKGGHFSDSADDVLLTAEGEEVWFRHPHIETKNTHGTGCTLSSAIASNLALGCNLEDAVGNAKKYLSGALAHDPKLGMGNGPLNHMWQA